MHPPRLLSIHLIKRGLLAPGILYVLDLGLKEISHSPNPLSRKGESERERNRRNRRNKSNKDPNQPTERSRRKPSTPVALLQLQKRGSDGEKDALQGAPEPNSKPPRVCNKAAAIADHCAFGCFLCGMFGACSVGRSQFEKVNRGCLLRTRLFNRFPGAKDRIVSPTTADPR